jgi:uncharacterized protein YegP (UPF0339 family)
MAGEFVLKKVKGGQFMLNLVAADGETIGRSQTYAGPSGCSGGIKSVKACAPGGKIEDLT